MVISIFRSPNQNPEVYSLAARGGRRANGAGYSAHAMPSLVVEACQVLGVDPGQGGTPPTEEAVAAAFKKLAVRWHPDRNPDKVKEATQRFAEISAARDLLLDPPTNALLDYPRPSPGATSGGRAASSSSCSGGDPARSAHSQNLRAFEGDVTDEVVSGTLGGDEAAALFESFGLWAVWKCNACSAVCCRIRKNKYSCMCGHRLRDHDASRGFRCRDLKCPCKQYEFMVQDTDQPHKCRCKHGPKDHDPYPPHKCLKCDDCVAFDSPWTCNCAARPPAPHTPRHDPLRRGETRQRERAGGGREGDKLARFEDGLARGAMDVTPVAARCARKQRRLTAVRSTLCEQAAIDHRSTARVLCGTSTPNARANGSRGGCAVSASRSPASSASAPSRSASRSSSAPTRRKRQASLRGRRCSARRSCMSSSRPNPSMLPRI